MTATIGVARADVAALNAIGRTEHARSVLTELRTAVRIRRARVARGFTGRVERLAAAGVADIAATGVVGGARLPVRCAQRTGAHPASAVEGRAVGGRRARRPPRRRLADVREAHLGARIAGRRAALVARLAARADRPAVDGDPAGAPGSA